MLTILVCNEVNIHYTWIDAIPPKFQKLSEYQVSESHYNTKKKILVPYKWVGPSVITKINHVRYTNLIALHHTLTCADDKCESPGIGHISNLKIREKLSSIMKILYRGCDLQPI